MKYKGCRIGLIEKELLKKFLGVKDRELSKNYNESFSDIFKTARQKYNYSATIKRMEQKGLINFVVKEDGLRIVLTKEGKDIARGFILQGYGQLQKPDKWDGRWRMVMFDIPEDKRKLRNIIRFHLKKIGFVQIQGSVWIYPFPCEEIVTIIKTNFNLNDEVIYITTESFNKDFKFKKVFKL